MIPERSGKPPWNGDPRATNRRGRVSRPTSFPKHDVLLHRL